MQNPRDNRTNDRVVVNVKPVKGRVTRWVAQCSEGCEDLVGVKPISRHKGAKLAQGHINFTHAGYGDLKVYRDR